MTADVRSVKVKAPARLHLGFLDLNGSRGRRFGSVGLALDAPQVRLSVERSAAFAVSGPQAERVERFAHTLFRSRALPDSCRITIHEAIPQHAGLGSGTQLAIAVGVGLGRIQGLELSAREVAALYERGQRSGIGVGAFEHGGFMVDGGKGAGEEAPRIVCRIAFPEDWRVLLIFDPSAQGLHGEAEVAAFRALPEFSEVASAHLCRLMLMQGLPALVERDLDAFGRAIGELQRVIGDYFAPAQGARFTSTRVAEVLEWLQHKGLMGVGQSSWGPTGFAIVGSEAHALELARDAQARWGGACSLQFKVCKARNHGGEITSGETTGGELASEKVAGARTVGEIAGRETTGGRKSAVG